MDGLSEKGCSPLGYADNMTILNSRNFLQIVGGLPQEALIMLQQRYDRTHLSINPQRW